MQKLYSIGILIIMFSSLQAQHTFSICAVDTVTGEVGSAGASCIANSIIISDVHPGVGVIHTQAAYFAQNQDYAMELMNEGFSPEEIIDSVTVYDNFGDSTVRQYGVVDLVDGGRSASFTGENCFDWKGHITGPTYSIQGNILLGPEILDGIEQGFLNTEGNLACKLMGALQGAKVAGADTRCLEWGISSESAFIRVAQPGDAVDDLWLDINVKDVNGVTNALNPGLDPIDSLQSAFDAVGGCNYTGEAAQNLTILSPAIYPQPALDNFNLLLDGNFEGIQILNINGVAVYDAELNGATELSIHCETWPPGIYICIVYGIDGSAFHRSVVVQ